MFERFLLDQRGATTIEYAFVAMLVSVVIAAGAASIGQKLAANYYGALAAKPVW